MAMERKTNWFVRILIVLLCLFLSGLIVYRFLHFAPLGDLGVGVLVVLTLIVVLVLSESFDSFSVGKLLSLSREVQKHEAQVAELKRENTDLRSQIVSVATTVTQRQNSTNIMTLPQDFARYLVTKAPEQELREKQAEEQSPQLQSPVQPLPPRIDQRRLEDKALDRFLQQNNFAQFPVVRDVRLQAQIEVLDPISNSFPIFDAYLNTLDAEVFIEVARSVRLYYRDRLYVMLSKFHHYRTIKKANVYLSLVVVILQDDEDLSKRVTRLLEEFQPAVASGLLKVVELRFTAAETADLFIQSATA